MSIYSTLDGHTVISPSGYVDIFSNNPGPSYLFPVMLWYVKGPLQDLVDYSYGTLQTQWCFAALFFSVIKSIYKHAIQELNKDKCVDSDSETSWFRIRVTAV